MKRIVLFSMSLLLFLPVFAQQEIGRGGGAVQVESPVINQNNSVTFRLLAHNTQSVSLIGDVMRGLGVTERAVNMVKGENGVWSYTSNYRVKKDKASRAISGLSMGGFHTMHISRLYPNTFDYVGLFSAALGVGRGEDNPVYANIVSTLQTQNRNGLKLYWIAMGKADGLYQGSVNFRKQLDDIGIKYTYRESEGGHTWTNWRLYLTEFVPLLFK